MQRTAGNSHPADMDTIATWLQQSDKRLEIYHTLIDSTKYSDIRRRTDPIKLGAEHKQHILDCTPLLAMLHELRDAADITQPIDSLRTRLTSKIMAIERQQRSAVARYERKRLSAALRTLRRQQTRVLARKSWNDIRRLLDSERASLLSVRGHLNTMFPVAAEALKHRKDISMMGSQGDISDYDLCRGD